MDFSTKELLNKVTTDHKACCSVNVLFWCGRVLWLFYHSLRERECFQHWLVSVQFFFVVHHDISMSC